MLPDRQEACESALTWAVNGKGMSCPSRITLLRSGTYRACAPSLFAYDCICGISSKFADALCVLRRRCAHAAVALRWNAWRAARSGPFSRKGTRECGMKSFERRAKGFLLHSTTMPVSEKQRGIVAFPPHSIPFVRPTTGSVWSPCDNFLRYYRSNNKRQRGSSSVDSEDVSRDGSFPRKTRRPP